MNIISLTDKKSCKKHMKKILENKLLIIIYKTKKE